MLLEVKMKIGVISDTHDHLDKIQRAINIFREEKIDLLYHAGDFVSPFTAKYFLNIPFPLVGVFGNNDGDRIFLLNQFKEIGSIHPEPFLSSIDHKKIIMFHKNDVINELAESQAYDLIIYGHTHKVEVRNVGKTLILNPGECCGWLNGEGTIAILDLNSLSARIISIP